MAWRPTGNKYGAKKTEYGGVLYDSKAEAAHALRLDLLKAAGVVRGWERQVPIMVGEPGIDRPWKIDFVVDYVVEGKIAEEVKGFETTHFRRQKRQWAKRGPFPLHVIKGKTVKVIMPRGGDE